MNTNNFPLVSDYIVYGRKLSPKKYIITDWAGNVLDFTGRFMPETVAVPNQFDNADYAEDYLNGLLGDNYETDRGEYYIEEKIEAIGTETDSGNMFSSAGEY